MGLIKISDSKASDLHAILRIYSKEVKSGFATFEEVPPCIDEMAKRRESVLQRGLPYLVARIDDRVVGYAYANNHRPRPAYRYSVENSVYIDTGFQRKGIGKALLQGVINRCEQGDWRQMIAVIGGGENTSSIGLHKSLGFRHVGTLEAVGFKLGCWVDTVIMQLPLNGGSQKPL